MTDWNALRAEFPALESRVYLNTAGGGPMCRQAVEAASAYYEEFYREGDTRWSAWLERVEEIRERLARFLKVSTDEIAFLGNASQGLNAVADVLDGDGDVAAVAGDFPSVTLPWLQRRRRVRFIDSPESVAASLGADNDVLALGSVQYKTGFRFDLERLGALCREGDVRLVVDATQEFGVFPIDLERAPVDALVFSAYKWATAGYGIAPLYLRRELLAERGLPAAGWRSARVPYAMESTRLDLTTEARGLELGHPPFAGVFALGGALELFESIGIDAIEARVQRLVDTLLEGLDARGFEVVSPRARARRSSIVMVLVTDPEAVAAALAERNILVSARGEALRVSLHYYNDEEDIAAFLGALPDVAR